MLSAGPCQREIRKSRRTARMSNAAMTKLIKGANDISLPAIETILKGLASRSSVSQFTPITNPFETIDMTKPNPTPHSTKLPATLSMAANLETLLRLCVCTAFRATVSYHSGQWCHRAGGLISISGRIRPGSPASQNYQTLIWNSCHGGIFCPYGIKFAETRR